MRMFIVAAAAALAFSAASVQAAEPIEGNWKTASGATAQIAPCGGSYCVTLKTGKHAGKQIGKMSGAECRIVVSRKAGRCPHRPAFSFSCPLWPDRRPGG